MLKLTFWLSLVTIFYTYIGYPILITVLARVYGKKAPRTLSRYPSVSVIIAVYNEDKYIGRKIENCLQLDYPRGKLEIVVGSDGSLDGTDDIVRSYGDKGIKVLLNGERRGKPFILDKLVEMSSGEILFFTDARQIVEKDALKNIVRNFEDKEVGCVSGELVYDSGGGIAAEGIGIYWEYEKFLREKESDLYSMIGATGAIYACRRELFKPVPEDVVLDDMYTPFDIVNKGYRVIFEREAVAHDIYAETPHDEHRRKKRTLSGNYQIFSLMPQMLNPFKNRIAFQVISHKLLRVLAPFFMITLFISNMFLCNTGAYDLFFALQVVFYAIALSGALFRRRINKMRNGFINKILGIPYLFCLLNFSALMGLWEFLFERMDVKWEKAVN